MFALKTNSEERKIAFFMNLVLYQHLRFKALCHERSYFVLLG